MIGGVTVNIILAFFIYAAMLWYWGESYLPTQNVKNGVTVDSLAESIGMRDGDKILGVDHIRVDTFTAIPAEIILREAKSIQVERNGQELSLAIPEGFIRQMIKQKSGFATPRFPYYILDLPKESAARTAGFQKGDQLISLNGEYVPYLSDFQKRLRKLKNQEVSVGLIRGRDTLQRSIKVSDDGKLGVYADVNVSKYFTLNTREFTFFEAIPAGFNKCISTLVKYVQQLRLIFVSKEIKASESVGGFLSIGNLFPGQWDWMAFWEMTALLSIILAFFNILPIPALDGGHVLFLLYEMVTGRKPNEKFLEYAQVVGMVLLFGLLLYANGLDIWRNIISKWFS
jgi:regulator of sigma E protease